MENELKPCHRCFHSPVKLKRHKWLGKPVNTHTISCPNCGLKRSGYTKEQAIKTWNDFPVWKRIESLESEIARLRGAVRRYGSHIFSCRFISESKPFGDCDCGFNEAMRKEGK